jgi:glutamate-1-semialdehyde 2,1-aminomutase
MKSVWKVISDEELARLNNREQATFCDRTPQSAALYERSRDKLYNGVPMPWMSDWPNPHPFYIQEAIGNRLTDVDGNMYVDFCLGDTGAMFGHSPEATVEAVDRQVRRGITTMLPTEDSIWVAEELQRRFGLPFWQIAMTATDANRFVLRLCRALTKRPKVLVFNGCYHGSLDECLIELDAKGKVVKRSKHDVNPACLAESFVRVVEFNDLEALERELAFQDVACVLTEPVMTNCGMILPAEGFLEQLRTLTRKYGSYLVIDETHTLSTGIGGYTSEFRLDPDFFTFGKSVGGGIPVAGYGFTEDIAEAMSASFGLEKESSPMGIGGTLSANAFAVNAMRHTLEKVATKEAYDHMISLANQIADGLEKNIAGTGVPWSVTRCGARVELQFMPRTPINGSEAKGALFWDLIWYTHLYLLNRGLLITPFHNMMLISPVTTSEDVDRLVKEWGNCTTELASLAD